MVTMSTTIKDSSSRTKPSEKWKNLLLTLSLSLFGCLFDGVQVWNWKQLSKPATVHFGPKIQEHFSGGSYVNEFVIRLLFNGTSMIFILCCSCCVYFCCCCGCWRCYLKSTWISNTISSATLCLVLSGAVSSNIGRSFNAQNGQL